jgi:flagellar hook-associated protein 3 FlgL
MAIRVSQFQTVSTFLYNNGEHRRNEADLLEHIATGKRVSRASDAPLDFRRIAESKTEIETNGAFVKNIQTALGDFAITETAMNTLLDSLERASELAVQGANDTYGANGRNTIANEMTEILNGMINTLNTRHEGRYLFSGTATTTQPFDATGAYFGNSDLASIRTSRTDTMAINVPGDQLAYGPLGSGSNEDMIDLLQDVITELQADNTAGIAANLPRFRTTIDRLNSEISSIGAKTAHLIDANQFYEDMELTLSETLAELEEADLAEDISLLNANSTAQEALLRTQNTINRQSLLDYLG